MQTLLFGSHRRQSFSWAFVNGPIRLRTGLRYKVNGMQMFCWHHLKNTADVIGWFLCCASLSSAQQMTQRLLNINTLSVQVRLHWPRGLVGSQSVVQEIMSANKDLQSRPTVRPSYVQSVIVSGFYVCLVWLPRCRHDSSQRPLGSEECLCSRLTVHTNIKNTHLFVPRRCKQI